MGRRGKGMGRREIDGEVREGMGDKCEERDEGRQHINQS